MDRETAYFRWRELRDGSAFAFLVEELRPQLLRTAYNLVAHCNAEEVVQEAVCGAFTDESVLPATHAQWARGLFNRLNWRAGDANRARVFVSLHEGSFGDETTPLDETIESPSFKFQQWNGSLTEAALGAVEVMRKNTPLVEEYLNLLEQGYSKKEIYDVLAERHGGPWSTWKGRCLKIDRNLCVLSNKSYVS